MNTLHFKYAVEVARTRSITQAAENLYMAQPNLSKAIKELEDSLGIVIFERNSKGVTPTPKGLAFLEYAKNVLVQLEHMEALAEHADPQIQRFRIAIPHGSYIAEGCISFVAGLDREGQMDILIKEMGGMEAISGVAEGEYALGIIRFRTEQETYFMDYLQEKGLESDLIWEFDSVLLMAQNHPLAEAEQITAETLAPYAEITYGDGAVPYLGGAKRPVQQNQRSIYVCEQGGQLDMLADIPWTYMWSSPISERLQQRYRLVQRQCGTAEGRYRDVLIYPKGYKFGKIDKDFIDKLYNAKNVVAFRE